ncbi:hypothetical protein BD413DRAFT_608499 [Trametes elegans]|nr:hypothetical protein BD413DRAFT_608499 [Trametes elegans]
MSIHKPVAVGPGYGVGRKTRPASDSTVSLGGQGTKRRGKRRITLDGFMDIPMDIFLEITAHLLPMDILNLSRVSHRLRDVLLSKDSRAVWATARRNVVPPLPDCPPCISEVTYAHCIFELRCEACNIPCSKNICPAVPVRLCGRCAEANIVYAAQQERKIGPKTKRVLRLVPKAETESAGSSPMTELQDLDGLYYAPELNAVYKEYSALYKERDKDEGKALQEFELRRKAETLERREFAEAVFAWIADAAEEKLKTEQGRKLRHTAAVRAKLNELGVAKRDLPIHYMSDWIRLVHRPYELTPRAWEELRPQLLTLIEANRRLQHAKIIESRRGLIAHFYRSIEQMRFKKLTLPTVEEALRLPCLENLINNANSRTVEQTQFYAILPKLFREAREYQRSRRHDLAKMIVKADEGRGARRTKRRKANAGKSSIADAVLLDAPSSIFRCHGKGRGAVDESCCSMALSCAGILEHWKNVHRSESWSTWLADSVRAAKREREPHVVERLLDALGLPRQTSMTAVEELKATFITGKKGNRIWLRVSNSCPARCSLVFNSS